MNENWGMLSTMVPNRTAKWGNCCEKPRDRVIYDFLNHPKTLMLAVNQHTNISHPKVLVLPRGIPLTWERTSYIVWDLIRFSIDNIKKQKLLFASSSSWGPRKTFSCFIRGIISLNQSLMTLCRSSDIALCIFEAFSGRF